MSHSIQYIYLTEKNNTGVCATLKLNNHNMHPVSFQNTDYAQVYPNQITNSLSVLI